MSNAQTESDLCLSAILCQMGQFPTDIVVNFCLLEEQKILQVWDGHILYLDLQMKMISKGISIWGKIRFPDFLRVAVSWESGY